MKIFNRIKSFVIYLSYENFDFLKLVLGGRTFTSEEFRREFQAIEDAKVAEEEKKKKNKEDRDRKREEKEKEAEERFEHQYNLLDI